MNIELVIFVLYMIGLIAFGFYHYRKTKGVEDFFVAGRGLRGWVVAFSHEASDLGGTLILGAPGLVYVLGLAGSWVVWIGMSGVFVAFWVNGITFRRMGTRYGAMTIPDVLALRYYDKGNRLRVLSAVLIAFCALLYISAMGISAAKVIEMAFGIDYTFAVLIGGGVVLIYTVTGGMRAVAWTDVFQGILMTVGIVLAAGLAVWMVGGFGGIASGLSAADPTLTNSFSGWGLVVMGIGFILGGGSISYLGQPHLTVRYLTARSGRDIGNAMWISVVIIGVWMICIFLAGAAGRALYPDASMLPNGDPEQILLYIFKTGFPGWLSGLFLAGAMAAIMSTADSFLLVAASAVSTDIYQKVMRPDASDKSVMRVARYATVIIAVIGIATALVPRSVMWAIWLSWGAFAQFGPLLVLGMYWKRATWKAAFIALIVGFVVNIGWFIMGWNETIIHEAVPGMVIGTLLMVIISLLDKAPPKEIQDMVEYVRSGREVGTTAKTD